MKPIIMSTEDVRAVLDGRKTMARRVMKPQPVRNGALWELGGAGWSNNSVTPVYGHSLYNRMPYKPGDVLWVRETWNNMCHGCDDCSHTGYQYKADRQPASCIYDAGWMSPVTMPREAARLFLRVTDVRVEKNQESGAWEWLIEFERIGKAGES